jgi:hypothetical protein
LDIEVNAAHQLLHRAKSNLQKMILKWVQKMNNQDNYLLKKKFKIKILMIKFIKIRNIILPSVFKIKILKKS